MSDPSAPRVVLTPEEFSLDAKERLGHTNGSIYQRRPGIDGFHDGQIMVRLKKHRFIIIDYSIIPNEDDMQAAALDPCISIPDGAGTQKCSTAECTKVGVPILLYDSNPGESVSLYMRSGLCFTCQRVRSRDACSEFHTQDCFLTFFASCSYLLPYRCRI